MAPAKNPNATSKATSSNSVVSTNSNSSASHSSAGSNSNAAAANASGGRKQTGTVPKTTAKSTSTTNSVSTEIAGSNMQHGQKSILQPPPAGVTQLSNRCSPLNVVASIQQQQQQQHQNNQSTRSQHHHHHHHQQQQQQFKNTEIVAPIRRELKDLNEYLLTTVVTTANNTTSNNSSLLQQGLTAFGTANSDLENSQENQQRFCYPVRPIPRRNQSQTQQQSQNDYLNATATNTVNSNINAAIGVVIPTTPGLPASAANTTNASAISTVQPVSNTNSATAVSTNSHLSENPTSSTALGPQFEQHLQLLVLQRLKQLFDNSQVSPFLNLTTSVLPGIQASSSAALANTILNHNTHEIAQLAQRVQNININNTKINLDNSFQAQQKDKKPTMVHEINPSTLSNSNEVVVNSTSLEDVALSEMSDRAQSIQSLHSNIETPTPDNTPSYEELQQRLEASNRNIQNMQEQQQQLLMLQNAAKQHLSDMERLRQQAGSLSFPLGTQLASNGGDGAPEYQSVQQVQSDMANLVGRMKNLTTFIQNQNELSSLLGDDGPEILAEQEALQQKLESLRTQRDEMRSLVNELQSINRSAEETAKEARQRQFEQEKDIEENNEQQEAPTVAAAPSTAKPKKSCNTERDVPIEVSRNVPIELLHHAQRPQANGNEQSETETEMDEDERRATASLIQQKVSDIEAMKAQLKRLKDMMDTVNLIESHTAKDPKMVGRSAREVPIAYDRERTPVAAPYSDDNGNEEFMVRKVHMLNEVTSDLKAQAESLKAEKARIQALKDEIERRKKQAAAAVQIGDEALKRNSLTPTPLSQRTHEERWEEHLRTQHERDQLKEEYERKKKEFQQICKRLEQEDAPGASSQQVTTAGRHDIVSEADDEAEEDNIESDYAESAKFVPTSTPAATRSNDNARTGKDSLNSTGVSSNAGTHIAQAASSTHDGASLEGASIQSGSSRSFSIPPPMSAMGISFPGPIPPPLPTAWNPHQYYYATGVPPPPPPPQTAYALNNNTAAATTTLSQSECACTSNNLGAATSSSTATSAATNTAIATDPMLQQFIQTQQMLINSVCQCNQMLWHQQREIDNLNQTIHVLQERIISLTGAAAAVNGDVVGGYTLRSESVPPPSLNGIPTPHALPNNLYMSLNRAQSEQPALYIPRNSVFSNYQQQQQQQQQQHVYRRVSQQQSGGVSQQVGNGGYNFTSETQHHNSSSAASASLYTNLNNAAPQSVPPPPPPPTTLFNNEIPTPQSPVVGQSGPAPIFMHHHNNAIHQNNVNLRTQNQQQQQQQQLHHHSNISGSTLNNQVPPGNRANNYWDNFRSYSRQNLLSTNSTKSNEEQQQMLQQQQHHNQEGNFDRSQTMQQPQIPTQSLYHEQNLSNAPPPPPPPEDCVNNLNYANNEAASKYLRILQRSRINQQQQHQQQYQQNMYQQQQRDFLQQLNWLEHQDNNNSNTSEAPPSNTAADLMYHNYNIQQSNKVGPKPNWRFRNINEEYNHNPSSGGSTLNRLQQPQQTSSSTLPRYQNTLTTFSQPQPQQPTSLAAGSNQHFLNLQAHNQAARSHDFLLRPAVDVNGEDDVNYNFLNTGVGQQQQLPLDYSNPSGGQHQGATTIHNIHNISTECNDNNEDEDEDEEEEEEDDTTSEEIKRNLLVNALKNDKFTTKFYESIKEDVFRRLESMLLDKDNMQMQSSTLEALAQTQQFNNNIANNALRKLNLNEQRDQMQHQQIHINQQPLTIQPLYDIHNQPQRQESPIAARNDSVETDAAATQENIDNENEKPEEDTNWRQNNITVCSASSTPNQTSSISTPNSTTAVKNCGTKKRKNMRSKQTASNNNNTGNSNVVASSGAATNDAENLESLRGACSLAAQQHHHQQQNVNKPAESKNVPNAHSNAILTTLPSSSTSSMTSSNTITNNTTGSLVATSSQTNECDLIKYIISRIRNQTHANTLINDALLVEVAKLTATVAQNAQPLTQRNIASSSNSSSNNISPKKIYTKIKKLTIPKERDEFLIWYQQYLENTLFGNCHKDDTKLKTSAATMATKPTNNNQFNGVANPQPALQVAVIQDDGDLAEADQNCSSNTSGSNYHHLEDDTASKTLIITPNCNNNEFVESPQKIRKDCVNAEGGGGACALTASSQQHHEELTQPAVEKNDLMPEKQDYNEKE